MDIIEFPKGNKPKKLIATLVKGNNNRLYLNGWNVTCPECNNLITFKQTGMIFKTIEFNCNCCGNLCRISNPGTSG